MAFAWYQWAILGLILMGTELLIPAFVLVWFGLGACITAVLLALFPQISFPLQMSVWLVASLFFVALWFGCFKSKWHKTLSGRSSAGIVGEVGLLIAPVDPYHQGQVKFQGPIVGSDSWACIADEAIAVGTHVKVVSVEGNILKVSPAS